MNIRNQPHLGSFLTYCFWLVIITAITFGSIRIFHIPAGQFIDWIVGLLTIWWLLIIVTVPWNIYFDAKAVTAEASESSKLGIEQDKSLLSYVDKLARSALLVALALHFGSALALFALSYFHITNVGYVGAVVAMLLTVVRPAMKGYEYIYEKLQKLKERVRYPREDVLELRNRVRELETKLKTIEQEINPSHVGSLAYRHQRQNKEFEFKLESTVKKLSNLEIHNREEHEQLGRQLEQGLAKIASDSQFLDHVREVVRMFKSA